MGTDLELYRVFCEVVKYKNISRTAESMYLSQSAITQSIQKLESILGGKLFYRNKTGVELTEEGKNLYEYVKDSIETMNNAENIFSKYINLDKGKIRIGGGDALISSLIFEPLVKFMKEFPNIDVAISNGITDNLMRSLSNGELDIVVLNIHNNEKKYSNIDIINLKKAYFSFFASKSYLKNNKFTNFDDVSNHKFILPKATSLRKKLLNDYCKKENIELYPSYEISSTAVMKKMVLNDLGIGFINTESIKDIKDKVTIIKEVEIETASEGIALMKNNMSSKATLELVKMIKEYYKQN